MPRLALYLLGPPRLELDGEPVRLPRRKALALFAYLVVTQRNHSRDSLAALFWPTFDQSGARAELRRTLSVINRTLGEGWLTADRETAGLNPDADVWLDVNVFRDRQGACGAHGPTPAENPLPLLEQAAELYGGGFMAGFTLRDSAAFDEWQRYETEALRDEFAGVLERLARWYGAREKGERAIGYA